MPTVLVVGRPDAPDPLDLLPLLSTLSRCGYRVVLLATEEQRRTAAASGAEFRLLPPLPPEEGMSSLPLIRRIRRLFRRLFIESMHLHWDVVSSAVEQERPDVVLADALCFAACMLAELPRSERPAVIVLGTIPPPHVNLASAPYGLGIEPSEAMVNRLRNRLLHQVVRHVMLGSVLPELRSLFSAKTGHQMGRDTYDAAATAEVWAQCEPERFEYPLHVAANLRLVGPLEPVHSSGLPGWWRPGDERGLIAVRAAGPGSMQDLVLPAIAAFEGRSDLRVVITGVERAAVVSALGRRLPDGVEVDGDLPAGQVLPGTRVVVMRGWFVHALHALQQGVPVVAVGTGAEQVETAARLRWHGCGTGIRTDAPTGEQLRIAVDQVIDDPLHERAAARIAAQSAGMHAEDAICDLVDDLLPSASPAPLARTAAGGPHPTGTATGTGAPGSAL